MNEKDYNTKYCSFHEIKVNKQKEKKCHKRNNGEGCEYLFDKENLEINIMHKKCIEKKKIKDWKNEEDPLDLYGFDIEDSKYYNEVKKQIKNNINRLNKVESKRYEW